MLGDSNVIKEFTQVILWKLLFCTGEFTLQFDKYILSGIEEHWQREVQCFSVPSLDISMKIGVQKVYEMKEVFLIISCDEARESQHNGEGGFFPSPQCSLNVIEGAERK